MWQHLRALKKFTPDYYKKSKISSVRVFYFDPKLKIYILEIVKSEIFTLDVVMKKKIDFMKMRKVGKARENISSITNVRIESTTISFYIRAMLCSYS